MWHFGLNDSQGNSYQLAMTSTLLTTQYAYNNHDWCRPESRSQRELVSERDSFALEPLSCQVHCCTNIAADGRIILAERTGQPSTGASPGRDPLM
jgi:hypothetical protein